MLKRSKSQTSAIKADAEEITRQYNECIEEIKRDKGCVLGSLALHHEAMKLMAQKQSCENALTEEENRPNSRSNSAISKSFDGISQLFFGEDDYGGVADTIKSGMSGSSSNNDQNRRRHGRRGSGRSNTNRRVRHPNRHSKTRGSLNKLSLVIRESIPLSILNSSPNSSIKSAKSQVIRRRESTTVSGFEEVVNLNDALKDLELSDSEGESMLGDGEDEDNVNKGEGANIDDDEYSNYDESRGGKSSNNSGRRGYFARRGSAKLTKPMKNIFPRRQSRRRSSASLSSDGSIQEEVIPDEVDYNSYHRKCSALTQSSDDSPPSSYLPGKAEPFRRRASRRFSRRRSSLVSVDEDAALPEKASEEELDNISNQKRESSLGDSFSVHDGSLICGWGHEHESLAESASDLDDYDGNALICEFRRRSSLFTNDTSSLHGEANNGGKKEVSEFHVGKELDGRTKHVLGVMS